MASRFIRFETTPNPNAIKCLLTGSAGGGWGLGRSGVAAPPADGLPGGMTTRSFRSPAEAGGAGGAAGDPLASRLFQIDGVAGVLIGPGWFTVNKAASGEWARLKPEIEKAVASLGGGGGAL